MRDLSARRQLPQALVVGACGGMGLACVRRMGQRYRVLLADIDAERAKTLAAGLAAEGIAARALGCDVTDGDSVAATVADASREAPLAALVHVVGLSPSAGNWQRIMAVNLQGAARMAEAVLPALQAGVGVFISSTAAHVVGDLRHLHPLLDDPLAPGFLADLETALDGDVDATTAYRISKYGLNRMCRRLAARWGDAGHRIMSLSPGLIATPMGEREFAARPEKFELLRRTPLKRQGDLGEIADAVEFLCSERASFISGTDLLVDGGLTAARTA